MKRAPEVKRPYQSTLRGAQAQSTREAVIAAAARLFAEKGYAATSIEDIAAAAGVSRATVFTSVGGKAKLLKTALDVAIVGDDEPIALPDRPRSKAIRAEPDPRKYLALYAELVTEMDGRLAAGLPLSLCSRRFLAVSSCRGPSVCPLIASPQARPGMYCKLRNMPAEPHGDCSRAKVEDYVSARRDRHAEDTTRPPAVQE